MSASLCYVFGFHCNISHGLVFHGNKTLLFLAGQMCILHDIESDEQKFNPIPDLGIPTAIIQGSKHLLAIADMCPTPRVTLYDLESSAKKMLPEPEININKYICLCFSADFKYIAAQGGPPDWAMPVWIRDKRVLKTVYFPTAMQPDADITEIRFHPRDNDQLVAVGKKYFRLYKFEEEEGFKPFIFAKQEAQGDYLSIEWLPRERLAIGTGSGTILFFDGVELRYEITVSDESSNKNYMKTTKSETGSSEELNRSVAITCLVVTPEGIICTFGNQVVIEYIRTTDGKDYRFHQSIHLPKRRSVIQKDLGEVEEDEERITDMKLSPNDEYLAVCTSSGQLFYYPRIGGTAIKRYFKVVTQPVHKHSISGIDIAVKVPVIASCSQNTVSLWDYIKRERLMHKNFYDDILSVAIHPLGLHLVIGFTEYIRFFTILTNGLKEMALIKIRDCYEASFSYGGQVIAVANRSYIVIYNFITLEMIAQLRGHHGRLTAIVWNQDDTILISCDDKGAIYVWDFVTKQRIAENVVKGTAYSDAAVSSDGKYVYAVGSDVTIRQLLGSDILKEAPTGVELKTLALSHTGHMLFGGTVNGCLRAFVFPLTASATSVDVLAHLGKVTKLKVVFGDQYLITAGQDGMLCIWNIIDKEKRKKIMVEFSNACLIEPNDLKSHLDNLMQLKSDLAEIQLDVQYQLELKSMFFEQQKRSACGELEQQITSLNLTITHLSDTNTLMLSSHKAKCIRIQEENKAVFDKMEQSMREEVLKVYDSYDRLNEENKKKEDFLRNRIDEVQIKVQNLDEKLTKFYKQQIAVREKIIQKDLQLIKEKDESYQELCKQLKEGIEGEISELEAGFIKDIQLHQNEVQKLKGANEISQQKIFDQQKEIQGLNDDIKLCYQEQARLKNFISDLKKDKDKVLKVSEEKSSIIKELQTNLYDVHQMKQSLEKHEFVLTSTLKSQMEEKNVLHGSKIIDEFNVELETSKKKLKKHQQEIDSTANRIKNIKKELEKEKFKVMNMETVLQRYRHDLSVCSDVFQDPQKLKQSVKKLLDKYIGSIKAQSEESSTSAAVLMNAELGYQKQHLLKTIGIIKKQLQKDKKMHTTEYTRVLQENSEDINKFYKLQEELKIVQRQIVDMERSLGLGAVGTDRTTRQKLENIIAVVKKQTTITSGCLTDAEKKEFVIKMQKKNIEHLKELLEKDDT